MAKDKDPLKLVQMLADVAELEKSQKVAVSMAHLTEEARRLEVLEQYLCEYREQSAGSGRELDIGQVTRRHAFIDALMRAVSDQGHRVTVLRKELESTLGLWRDAKSRVSALKEYTGRIDDQERLRAERREQNVLDDMAGRRGGQR